MRHKVVVVGESGVGKTSLVSYFVEQDCSKKHIPTIGAGYYCSEVKLWEKTVSLDIWDTAGQELYRALVPQYARNARAALIVFDLSSQDSFMKVDSWLEFLYAENPDVPIIVFGNKNDLVDQREVGEQEIYGFCVPKNIQYMEGSALLGTNVSEVFTAVAQCCAERPEPAIMSPEPIPSGRSGQKGCC
jgi:small GTP-binding protein